MESTEVSLVTSNLRRSTRATSVSQLKEIGGSQDSDRGTSSMESLKRKRAGYEYENELETNDKDYEDSGPGNPSSESKRKKRGGAVVRQRNKKSKVTEVSVWSKFDNDIWMVIMEYCSPATLRNMCLASQRFDSLVDRYRKILVTSRLLTYGLGPDALPEFLSERQFNLLLEGRGCMNCDNKRVLFTHWTWCRRWCAWCSEQKVITETSARNVIIGKGYDQDTQNNIVASLPWGVRDRRTNRLRLPNEVEYQSHSVIMEKTFLRQGFYNMLISVQALYPDFPTDRSHYMALSGYPALLGQWVRDLAGVPLKKEEFFERHIAKAKIVMEKAITIDKAVRAKARKDVEINKGSRELRKQYFKDRAKTDLPDIPVEWIATSKPFLVATKIGKKKGTQRSWAILKRKILIEWDASYPELIRQAMWDREGLQERLGRDAMLKLATKAEGIVEKGISKEEHMPIEETPIGGELVEEEENSQPYSIWADKDLAIEYKHYSRRV